MLPGAYTLMLPTRFRIFTQEQAVYAIQEQFSRKLLPVGMQLHS